MSSNADSFNLHILVAEDNSVNQMVARKLLEKLGCTCVIAENGEKAIEQLGKESFDLILMDCMMPIMDGQEATRQIRASGSAYSDIPIIAFTANAMESDQLACKAAGMNDFLDKPVTIDRLKEMIGRWAEQLKQPPR